MTVVAAFVCFAMFNPARQITSSPVVLPMACLAVCVILSFFERGLYAPAEIVSRDLPWRRIVLAWLQAVAIGTLVTICVAAVSGTWEPRFDRMSVTIRGPWLPTFLLVGFAD